MPVPANPQKREFYVYEFVANDYPFSVGIGRDRRDTDRIRYVRSLLTPKNREKLQGSSVSVRVMAELIRRNRTLKCRRIGTRMTRSRALAVERDYIARLVQQGYMLTNWHHNPHRHPDANKAVRAILGGLVMPKGVKALR